MNRNKSRTFLIKLFKGIIVFFIFTVVPSSGEKKPEWVKKRPIIQTYYIGIAVAEKTKENKDYIRQAKNNALNELASEITINISSEIMNVVSIQSGLSENEFRSEVQSTTKANLEGYELIDSWEDKNEYWVYYRLSKVEYERAKRLKMEKAISLSKDLFDKAKSKEKENNPADGLIFYLQAFYPIQNYIAEPLKTEYKGSKIFLRNEIYSSLQSLISKIELRTKSGKRNAKVGKPLKGNLDITAIYTDDKDIEHKIYKLPIKFSFIKGSGNLIERARTNKSGIARINVAKVISNDKLQIIKSELDLFGSAQKDSSSLVVSSILRNLSVPSVNVILNVTGLSIYFESSEKNLGVNLNVPSIAPKIKNLLSEKGITFVEDMGKADLLIQFAVESRKGNVISRSNLHVAYADLSISAIDLATGDEVYSNAIVNIKGVQLNYDKAGLKALDNAYEKIVDKILPELISTIQE